MWKKLVKKQLYLILAKKNKNKSLEKIKTTNVNILLNRVRLDEKRIFKKRILFASIFITLLCGVSAYLII